MNEFFRNFVKGAGLVVGSLCMLLGAFFLAFSLVNGSLFSSQTVFLSLCLGFAGWCVFVLAVKKANKYDLRLS